MFQSTLTLFTVLTTIQTCTPNPSHSLQITDLNNNPGIFAIKIGKVFLKEGYHKLIHEFKLHPYHSILRQYETIITELEQNEQLEDLNKILKQKHKQASLILQSLIPKRRQQRSINTLGSLVKSITGNLDNEDLTKLNFQINSLKFSNNVLVTENNEQIKINQILQDRLNNITKESYRQSIEISKVIRQTRMSLDRPVEVQHMLHLHNVVFNLDTIRHQLEDTFEAVQLSRLGVIPTTLLQPAELDLATHLLKSQNVEIASDDETYEYLKLRTVHNDSSIIFLVEVPKFKNGNYQLIRIAALPINRQITKINNKFAIISETESFLSYDKCSRIENTFVCNVDNLTNVTLDECYHQLLRGKPSKCEFSNHPSSLETEVIENYGILVKNTLPTVLLTNTCGYGPKHLVGTFFITFNNCSITIGNRSYDNKMFRFEEKIDILPLHFVSINRTDIVKPIEALEKLQINNRHRINHLEITNKNDNLANIGGIVIIATISITIFFYLIKENFSIRKFIQIQPEPSLNRDGSV